MKEFINVILFFLLFGVAAGASGGIVIALTLRKSVNELMELYKKELES